MDRQLIPAPRRPTPRGLAVLAVVALVLAVAVGPNVALPRGPDLGPDLDLDLDVPAADVDGPAVGAEAGAPPAPYVPIAAETTTSPTASASGSGSGAGAGAGSGEIDDPEPTSGSPSTTPDQNSADGDPDGREESAEPAEPAVTCVVPDSGTGEWVVATVYDREGRTELATATLEVADEPAEWERGLMGRASLPDGRGMLFEFPDEAPRSFWMKDTHVALDIVFLDADGVVLNVEGAVPEPGVADDDLRRYHSDGPAKYVVEVERGFAAAHGVEAGSWVRFDDADECR